MIEFFYKYKDINNKLPDELKEYIYVKSESAKYQKPAKKTYNYGGAPRNLNRDKLFGEYRNKMNPENNLKKIKNSRTQNENIIMEIRSKLNKLSESNYETLINDILHMNIYDEEISNLLIDIIIQKATTEKLYIKLYVILCKKIIDKYRQYSINIQQILNKKIIDTINIYIEKMDDETNYDYYKNNLNDIMLFCAEIYNHLIFKYAEINEILIILIRNIENKKLYLIKYTCVILIKMCDTIKKNKNGNYTMYCNYINNLCQISKSDNWSIMYKCYIKDLVEKIQIKNITYAI